MSRETFSNIGDRMGEMSDPWDYKVYAHRTYPELTPYFIKYEAAVGGMNAAADRMSRLITGGYERHLEQILVIRDGLAGSPLDWIRVYCSEYRSWRELGFSDTYYHVTGQEAARQLIAGNYLTGVSYHRELGIKTNKNLAPIVLQTLLRLCDVSKNNTEYFVYCGPWVNAQWIRTQGDLRNRHPNDQIYDLLFDPEKPKFSRLHPRLELLLTALSHGTKPETINSLRENADTLLADITEVFEVKDGWYKGLRDFFYGRKEVPLRSHLMHLFQSDLYLDFAVHDERRIAPEPSVVLELDTDRHINSNTHEGIWIFTLGPRPLGEILSTLTIKPEAVKRIYASDEFTRDWVGKSVIPVVPFSDIPSQVWLGGQTLETVKPADPNNPLCALPYQTSPTIEPLEAAKRGLIAPAETLLSYFHWLRHATLYDVFPPGKDIAPNGRLYPNRWALDAYLRQGFHVNGVFSHRFRMFEKKSA